MFNRNSLFIIIIIMLFAVSASAEVVSKVAAVVNDSIITTVQLEKEFQKAIGTNPAAQNLDSAETDKMRRQLLDKLIEEELLNERIKQLRLKVTDEDVEAAVQDVQNQNNLTREQLKEALQQQGMDFTAYKENLRKQILRFKLIGVEVRGKAEVTSAEVRAYYNDHIDDYRQAPYMHLSRLTFPVPDKADQDAVAGLRNKAVEAREKLAGGTSISVLMVSYATAGVDGGDMGKFRVGELSGIFDRAVRDLEAGQVSEVVEMPNAFFIFKMVERNSGEAQPFDKVSGDIERVLMEQKQEQAFKDWNKGLRKDAYIDIRI